MHIPGSPASSTSSPRGHAWRARIAEVARGAEPASGLELAFMLEPGRWVDLDTVAEVALAGLRDAGVLPRGLRGLDALLATRADVTPPGVTATFTDAAVIVAMRPPGPVLLDVAGTAAPRAAPEKRAWRGHIERAWSSCGELAVPVWADVAFATAGSIAGELEPTLDALEPVLGRDPRGGRQEFFPNDHLILWLRVRRAPLTDPPVHLRLGTCS